MEKEYEEVKDVASADEGINDEFYADAFKQFISEFINAPIGDEEAEDVEITDEDVANFKEFCAKLSEEGFFVDTDEYDFTQGFLNDDELIRKFIASLKNRMNYFTDRSNFSEEENLAREKRMAYMETRLGDIMVAIGKSEDFPFEQLTDDERAKYFDKYLEYMEEYNEIFNEEE